LPMGLPAAVDDLVTFLTDCLSGIIILVLTHNLSADALSLSIDSYLFLVCS